MASVEALPVAAVKKVRRRKGLLAAAVAGVIAGGAFIGSARAGTFTWDINQSGNWSTGGSWLGGTAPTGANTTDNLIFGGVEGASYASTVDVIDPFAINGLTFNSSSTSFLNIINFTNTQGISLGGTNPFITQSGSGSFELDVPLILAANATFGGGGAGLTTFTSPISGTGSLTISGGNWKTTNLANSFSGGLSVNGGVFEIAPSSGNINLVAGNSGAGAGTVRISNGGELRLTAASSGNADTILTANNNARAIAFGPGGGTLNINGRVADGPNWSINLTNATGSTSVIQFNGGPNGLTTNNPADGNLNTGGNALRIGTWTGATASTPVRIELTNGAMIAMQGSFNTFNAPLTLRGVANGDVAAQGKDLTTGRAQLDSGTTQTINGVGYPTYTFNGGLVIEDTFQLSLATDQRVIDANITLRGTASGHPAQFGLSGRGTGTATTTTQAFPVRIGRVNDINGKTITIEDGALFNLDNRFRTDQNNSNGVNINAKTNLLPGANVRLSQSWARSNDTANNHVGYHEWLGDIVANATADKEPVIEVQLPVMDGSRAAAEFFGGATFGIAAAGGAQTPNAADLIVNGSNTGEGMGLKITAIARTTQLYTANNGSSAGLAFSPDPVSNAAKLTGDPRAIASSARLAALTGSGGFITFAPADIAFPFPNGGDWAASVPVGMKVIDNNISGDDVMLNGPFTHNINIVSGATLNGNGNLIGPSSVTANLGLIKGTGTIANAIINTGARLAPGFSIGTMNATGPLTINGIYEAQVTTAAQDLLSITGDLNIGNTSVLDLPSNNTYDGTSTYTLATYTGTLLGAFSAINNLPDGYIVDYGAGTNSSIRLIIPPAGAKIWNGTVNGNWDTVTGNWQPSKFINGNDVTFDDSALGTTTVNIVSPVTPASVTVNNATKNYTIGGASITGSTGLVKGLIGTLTLTGTNSFTGPVTIKNGVISVATLTNSGVGGTLGAGSVINMGDPGTAEVPPSAGTLRFTGANGSTNRNISLIGAGGIIDTPSGSNLTLSGSISGTSTLTKINSGSLIISGNNAATFSGPMVLLGNGTTTVTSAGALGLGQTTVGDGTSGNANVLSYNIAGASASSLGVNVTPLSTLSVGGNLGALDHINVAADAVIAVNTFGASVDRNTNLVAQDGAIVSENAAGRNNALANRGVSSDLYFGLGANITDSMTLGINPGSTPWKGLSTDALADRTLNNGSTITASSDFNLHSINGRKLVLGSSGGGVTINGGAVNARIAGYVQLAGTAASYNGANFDVLSGSTLELINPTVLGSGVSPATVTVESAGLLRVSNSTAINSGVNVLDGGILDVSIPGLSGSGTITEQPGGIVQINNPAALSGTQLTGPSVNDRAVVRMVVDNIANLNTVNGAANFEIYGTSTGTQNAGITLSNGGMLTNDGSDRSFTSTSGINVGSGGAILAATTDKTLSYAGNITTTNPLTIGSNATVDGNAKLGTVSLGGVVNAPLVTGAGTLRVTGTIGATGSIDMVSGIASFADGSVLNGTVNTVHTAGDAGVQIHAGHNGTSGGLSGSGVINLTAGEDVTAYVEEVAAGAPALVNIVPTTINVTGVGVLSSDREGPALGNTGAIRYTNVRLQPGADLSLQRITENVGGDFTLFGNATLRGLNTNNAVRIGNINDQNAGYTLTITGDQPMRMVGTVQGTTRIRNIANSTIQLNTTNFNPSYSSTFTLGGNTYDQAGAWDTTTSGGPLPGLTGAGVTTISNDPGVGNILATGGTTNLNTTAPNTTLVAHGGRIVLGANSTVGNLNLDTTAELLLNGAFTLTANNLTQNPHGTLVIQPNADETATAGLGITSFLKVANNPPAVVNGMVSPSIVRRQNGNNEGNYLTYDATAGFKTAPATATNIDQDGLETTIVQAQSGAALTADRTVWALKTDQNIGGQGFTLNIGSGGIIFWNGGNGEVIISSNVNFGSAEGFIYGREGGLTFTNDPGDKNRDTLSGVVSGTAGITKFGGGDLHLSGVNTFTGPVSIQRGRLVIDGGTGIGTGNIANGGDGRNNPLTINGNSAAFNGNSNHHPSMLELNGHSQSADGVSGNGGINNFSATPATMTIDKSAGSATFSGAITGALTLIKTGPGTQVLAPDIYGANTYSGDGDPTHPGTLVNAGTLLVNNTNGSGTGTAEVAVAPGATLGGSGSITGFTRVQEGGHIAPGASPASVGTFTFGGLILSSSILDYEGNANGVDRINVGADGFGADGISTINLADLGGLSGGDYIIVDYISGNPDLANFKIGSSPAGLSLSLLNDTANTNLVLHIAAGGPPQWNVDADGQWGTASNWSGGIPNSPTAVANFLGKITAPRTITLETSKQVQEIHFDNANKYTIAALPAASLTIGNGTNGTIEVVNGTHEISAPLTLSGAITKSGPGTLIISGAQSHAAGSSLAITAGQVNLASNAGSAATATTPAAAALSINISGNGSKVIAAADQNLKALSIATADAGTQGFDLSTPATPSAFRSIHVYAADLASAKSSLYSAIRNAATNPGDGIYDSGLAGRSGSALGLAQLPDAHGDASIFIRPTKVGDVNLDGNVSIADFLQLAGNFGATATATWQEGDLNYDGNVSIADFLALAGNFGGSYSGQVSAISAADQITLSNFASSIGVDPAVIGSAVPEPGLLSLLAIGGCGLTMRRKRR